MKWADGRSRRARNAVAEPFKNLIGPREVEAAAHHLARAGGRRFDGAAFTAHARAGLAGLELKARAAHLADALELALPTEFERAAEILERALAPAPSDDTIPAARPDGLAGWVVWPLCEFVARRALAEPERGLAALHALTQRFTAEWAVRPFLETHPELTFRTFAAWTRDPSAHVRRLVSEGSRPRLPWGQRLRALIEDPSPTLPLLRALQDDPSAYVRRSVANHLNDITKDHPDVFVAWLDEHLPAADAARRALLKHAARSLVKAGDRRVLAAFGLGAAFRGSVEFGLAPARVQLGGDVTLTVTLRSTARSAQAVEVDFIVHHVKANGSTAPKVFKGWRRTVEAGDTVTLTKRHPVRPVSTRKYYPGVHRVELQVNGRTAGEPASFSLRV